MPTRMLREGILDSEAVNRLSLEAEVFYRRLMSLADDYGRADGRLEILRGRLFALQFDRWTIDKVAAAVDECCQSLLADGSPLVLRYEVGGKSYLQIENFGQRTRTQSRFPDPPNPAEISADNCAQTSATRGQLSADARNPPSNDRETAENGQIEQNLHDLESCQQPADICAQMPANVRTTRAQGRTYSKSEAKAYAKASANAGGARTGPGDLFDPDPGFQQFADLARSVRADRWLPKEAEAAWRAVVTSADAEAAVLAGFERWRDCADWRDGVVHRWDRWLAQRMFEQEPRPAKSSQQAAELPKDGVLAKLARRFA